MTLASAGARGSLITLISQMMIVGIRVLSIIILARLLAPEVFGLVAIVTSITVFVSALIFLGLPMATAQAEHLSSRGASGLLLINSAMGLVVGAALFFSAIPLSHIYGQAALVPITQWLALVPVFTGINAQFRQQLIRNLRFVPLSTSEVVAQATGIVAAVTIAIAGGTYEAVVAQAVVAPFVQLVLNAISARWMPPLPGMWRAEVAPIVRVGLNIFGTNLVKNASRSVILPVMGLYYAPAVLGQYDRAQQLTLAPINLTVDQLQRVVVPVLSRLRAEPGRMLSYMQRFQLVGAYFTSSLFLVFAALAQPVILLLFGPGWDLAASIAQVLAIGAVFRSSGQAMQWLFISASATGAGLRFNIWSQPAVAILSLAGLPWGVLGVATASTIAWALYWPISVLFAARAAGFPTWALLSTVLRAVFLFSFPCALAAWVPASLGLDPIPTLLLGLASAVVLGLIVSLLPVVRRDLRAVARALRMAVGRKSL